jgi:hypothetical protein
MDWCFDGIRLPREIAPALMRGCKTRPRERFVAVAMGFDGPASAGPERGHGWPTATRSWGRVTSPAGAQ